MASEPKASVVWSPAMLDRVRQLAQQPSGQVRRVRVALDDDVLAFFRTAGPRYHARMNAVLRVHMEQQERKAS